MVAAVCCRRSAAARTRAPVQVVKIVLSVGAREVRKVLTSVGREFA